MRIAFIAFPRYLTAALDSGLNEATALTAAFAARGAQLEVVEGLSPTVDWQRFDAVLPLGCWGYHQDPVGFRDFVTRLETLGVKLINAPEILRWNLDKSYLLDLRAAGVTVAPLLHFPIGSSPDIKAELARAGWSRYVVKPTISANSNDTIVGEGAPNDEVLALSQRILQRSGLLLQPFFEELQQHGEWSLLFFGSQLSHAVIKVPKPGDFRSQPGYGSTLTPGNPTPAVIEQARAALAAAPGRSIYGRVDGFLRDGSLQLIELEVIEPSLFLLHTDVAAAAGRFCDAILAAIH